MKVYCAECKRSLNQKCNCGASEWVINVEDMIRQTIQYYIQHSDKEGSTTDEKKQ